MVNKQPQKRKPLYRRAPTDNFRLQKRDKEIIFQIYKHRFLNSRHITALIEGSDQRILRRLNVLFHANYLARPLEQIRPYKRGSDPMVYGIGNEGAKLLERDFKIPRGKIEWTRKNREVKQVYLEHTLMVANFMVCLEISCKSKRGVELVPEDEIYKLFADRTDKQQNIGWELTVERSSGKTNKKYNLLASGSGPPPAGSNINQSLSSKAALRTDSGSLFSNSIRATKSIMLPPVLQLPKQFQIFLSGLTENWRGLDPR